MSKATFDLLNGDQKMLRVFIVLLALCFFTAQNAHAEKLSFKAMETMVCDSSKQACKNLKKLYNKAKRF